MTHYYVYYKRGSIWIYDRTFESKFYAEERVKMLIEVLGKEDAQFTVNKTLKDAFY